MSRQMAYVNPVRDASEVLGRGKQAQRPIRHQPSPFDKRKREKGGGVGDGERSLVSFLTGDGQSC